MIPAGIKSEKDHLMHPMGSISKSIDNDNDIDNHSTVTKETKDSDGDEI